MSKYKVIYHYSDGDTDEDDNYGRYYDSYDAAYDAGQYGLECIAEGAEILHLSNPGDYPYNEDDLLDNYFEVEEI